MNVLLSRGVSTFEGCGIGAHSIVTHVRGGSENPHRTWGRRLLHTWSCPVQCSTWQTERRHHILLSICTYALHEDVCMLMCSYLPAGWFEVDSATSIGDRTFHPHKEISARAHVFPSSAIQSSCQSSNLCLKIMHLLLLTIVHAIKFFSGTFWGLWSVSGSWTLQVQSSTDSVCWNLNYSILSSLCYCIGIISNWPMQWQESYVTRSKVLNGSGDQLVKDIDSERQIKQEEEKHSLWGNAP